MNRIKRILGLSCFLFLVIATVLYNPWKDRNAYTPSNESGEPFEVRKDIWVTPEVMEKITDEEISEFEEKYEQEDVKIIITEIGP